MIRHATIADMAGILRLAAAAHEGAGLSKPGGVAGFWFPFDAEIAMHQIQSHIASPSSLCLVYVAGDRLEGVLASVATNYPKAPIRMAAEVLFWIEPKHRGRAGPRMLRAFETWAKSQRCQFSHMASKRDPRFEAWLHRRGYRPIETQLLKVL